MAAAAARSARVFLFAQSNLLEASEPNPASSSNKTLLLAS
jgi:hypothetical protein